MIDETGWYKVGENEAKTKWNLNIQKARSPCSCSPPAVPYTYHWDHDFQRDCPWLTPCQLFSVAATSKFSLSLQSFFKCVWVCTCMCGSSGGLNPRCSLLAWPHCKPLDDLPGEVCPEKLGDPLSLSKGHCSAVWGGLP